MAPFSTQTQPTLNNSPSRYDNLQDFIHDLQHPNPEFLRDLPTRQAEGSTVFFWKVLSFFWLSILLVVLALVYMNS